MIFGGGGCHNLHGRKKLTPGNTCVPVLKYNVDVSTCIVVTSPCYSGCCGCAAGAFLCSRSTYICTAVPWYSCTAVRVPSHPIISGIPEYYHLVVLVPLCRYRTPWYPIGYRSAFIMCLYVDILMSDILLIPVSSDSCHISNESA
jgi:hypothetical protein